MTMKKNLAWKSAEQIFREAEIIENNQNSENKQKKLDRTNSNSANQRPSSLNTSSSITGSIIRLYIGIGKLFNTFSKIVWARISNIVKLKSGLGMRESIQQKVLKELSSNLAALMVMEN